MTEIKQLFVDSNPFGLKDEDYVKISDLLNKPIIIVNTYSYEKEDKSKIMIAFHYANETKKEGHYTVTGASAIVKVLEKDKVQDLIDAGEEIEATIIEDVSSKSGKKMYKFRF